MIHKKAIPAEWSNRRTRYDPPDMDDAVAAAQGLTDSIENQIEVVAQLMGLPEDEVRPVVVKAAKQSRTRLTVPASPQQLTRRTVVVERRNPRSPPGGLKHR